MAAKNYRPPKTHQPIVSNSGYSFSAKQVKLAKLYNLPREVSILQIIERPDCDELIVLLPQNRERCCPYCNSGNCTVKDSGRKITVRHTVGAAQQGTIITLHKSRFYCKDCQSTFYESVPWLHPSLRITLNLYYQIALNLTQTLSATTIAQINRIPPSIVYSVLDSITIDPPIRLPETLGIDEFKGSSGQWNPDKGHWDVNRFHCNISDSDTGCILDILPLITADHVKRYFRRFSPEQRRRVKYFCCDMHNGFISVAKELFPQANICIDLFHVVRLVNNTVTAVRRRLQREMEEKNDQAGYQKLKNAAKPLLINESKANPQHALNRTKRMGYLNSLFEQFPEIATAYDALQEFHHICAMSSENGGIIFQRAALSDWLNFYASCSVPEVEKTARSIRYWRHYLENTWVYKRSNSTCEGLNNKIKVLKRVCFGLHSFETFRKRVILACGPMRLASEPFTVFSQKREGKGIRL